MDRELEEALARLEKVNNSMDQLAREVQKQCEFHIREIEKCITAHSHFFEARFTSKPTAILQNS